MRGRDSSPTVAVIDVGFPEGAETDTLSVPIGAPVFNPLLSDLDSRLRPVPVGPPGELYLSGVQLARGCPARSVSADATDRVVLSAAPCRVTPANDNAEAIEFELAGLSAVASTLDTGVAKFDLQLTVTEGLTVSAGSAVMHDFAGAGLGEGPAPAGIRQAFACIAYLFDESAMADRAHRFTRFLRAIIDGPWLAALERPLLAAAKSAVDSEGNS